MRLALGAAPGRLRAQGFGWRIDRHIDDPGLLAASHGTVDEALLFACRGESVTISLRWDSASHVVTAPVPALRAARVSLCPPCD